MTTARELIYAALRLIGVHNPDSTILDEALVALNALLSALSADKQVVYAVTTESFSLVIGKSAYTIGSGGDISSTRPFKILEGVYIQDSNTEDYPVMPMTRLQYNQIASKIDDGRPTRIYYEPEFPLGKIRFNYEPLEIETVHMDSWKPFAEFAALSTSVIFPPEYKKLLQYNLAVSLAPEHGVDPSRAVGALASLSLQDVKGTNSEPVEEVTMDSAVLFRLKR